MEISMFMNLLRGESGGECDVINYVATILLSEEVPNYCWVENSRQYKMTDWASSHVRIYKCVRGNSAAVAVVGYGMLT